MSKRRRQPQQQVCGTGSQYEVKDGETLWGISESASGSGSNFDQIQNLDGSPIDNPDLIHPGQMLNVSGVCGDQEQEQEQSSSEDSGIETGGSGVTAAQPPGGAPPPDAQGDAPMVSDAPTQGSEEAPAVESPVVASQVEGNTEGSGAGGDVVVQSPPTLGRAPVVAPAPASGNSSATGNQTTDELLDAFASTSQLDALVCQTDLLDELNAFRNNDLGAAGINVVERLIPGYGAYDAVRDNWNGYWNFAERAPDDFILQLIASFEMWIGMAADVVRHLGYIFSLIQWICAATGVGAVPATIGGYSIGLIINGILAVLDGANAAMGLFGAAYSGLMLTFADLDEAERARYEFAMVHQVEHSVVSVMHVGMDAASAVLGNYVPAEAVKSGGKVLFAGAATGTRGAAVGLTRYVMGAGSEGADFGVAPEPRFDSGMQLPKDIIGDAAFLAEHPLPVPGLRISLFSEETRDRLYHGTPRACAKDATVVGQIMDPLRWEIDPMLLIAGFDPLDHSPSQVTGLALLEQDISVGIAQSTENQSALAIHESNQANTIAGMQLAGGVFAGLAEEQGSIADRLGSSLPGVNRGLSQQEQASGAAAQVSEGLSGVSTYMGQAQSASTAQVATPAREEGRSWWQKAGDWVVDNTIGALFGRLNGALASASGPAASGGAAAASGVATSQTAQVQVDAQAAPFREAAAGGAQDLGAARASQAQLQQDEARAAQVRALTEQRLAQARVDQQMERAQLDRLLTYRSEVEQERERQEAQNDRFAATVGPAIEQANVSGGVNAQQREALLAAMDAVGDLSDNAVSQIMSAASGVPSRIAAEAAAFANAFSDQEARRLGSVMGAVNAANSWQSFQVARSVLMGAEAAIADQLSAGLSFLNAMAQAPTEEEAERMMVGLNGSDGSDDNNSGASDS
jgi:hypothetical protein